MSSPPPPTDRHPALRSVEALLDVLEAPAPEPSSGSAAAVAAAMAASLVVLVARASRSWPEGAGVAAQARALRVRLVALAEEDAASYAAVLGAMRLPRTLPAEERDAALGLALVRAAEVPLAIASAAADVAELAALAAAQGKHELAPDAVAAAALAEGAARGAAWLVEVNLASSPGDERTRHAARHVSAAAEARARALGEGRA